MTTKITPFRLALLAIFLLSVAATAGAQCPQLVWSDEFDGGQLDAGKWNVVTGDGCDINLCGWGNNELQWYQPQNAVVSNGTLKIITKRETVGNRQYTSARLNTKQKGDWTYGRFEARIKLPTGPGMWPAFWMLPTDEAYGGWPQSGEIDIMELVGKEPATAYGTIHFGQPWPNNQQSGSSYSLNEGIFHDAFHTFAIEWSPGVIRWFVDDYLYLVKTTNDLSSRWPFDKRFHFLLNLAVGGNWPGPPNSSTVFPQTMEVDYVRVYDGGFPHLKGQRLVPNRAADVTYSIGNAPQTATFTWTVPAGAAITAGQGTSSITVDWGDTGGPVSVEVGGMCESRQLAVEVLVEAAFGRATVLENFDDPARINFSSTTGTLTEVSTPNPNGVNSSPLCGKYVRNASQQYDVLAYKTDAIDNGDDFVKRNKKFYIDVYTDAPTGTQILLQLENSSRARPENYPTGRHSRFEARTTKQNEWERLEFTLLDQPDAGTAGMSVDQLIFLFASNSKTGNTYHWDNFDVYAPQSPTGLFSPPVPALVLDLFPNPAGEWLTVRAPAPLHSLQLTDLNGRVLRRLPEEETAPWEIYVGDLPEGVYLLRAVARDGSVATGCFVRSR